MAQKVVTLYTDDLTGEESAEVSTYTVLVNGAGVEIDLTPESHDKLMEALQPFLQANGARRVRGGAASRRRQSSPAADARDTAAIRQWGRDNGYEINQRGRIAADVLTAYDRAH
jgi:Lsr2